MKRAANSLLILLTYPFMAFLRALVQPAPARGTGEPIRHTPRFYITRSGEIAPLCAIFRTSSTLRSFNLLRLGEERVRGLVHGFLMICFLSAYAAAETPAPAAEEISAIIRAEIMAMPEWTDADIRIEISGAISRAPEESFHLAPKGLTIGRRNVIAPIDVRGGKTARSLSIPAVVYVKTTAVAAARKISTGETINADDLRESSVETTDIGRALTRNPEEIVGKIALRAFAAGDHLPVEAFSVPPLVRRGDMVSLRLERNGIVLTSTARASENGRLGEFIQVKSVDFSSAIRARVTGPSEVSIH